MTPHPIPHCIRPPLTREALEHAARHLARQGLTERDVGELLGIGTTAAAQLIRPQSQWGSPR
jgi:hypothetical protein